MSRYPRQNNRPRERTQAGTLVVNLLDELARGVSPLRYTHLVWPIDGLYAVGVTFQSPGSRRGEAAKRTLGYERHTFPYTLKGFYKCEQRHCLADTTT